VRDNLDYGRRMNRLPTIPRSAHASPICSTSAACWIAVRPLSARAPARGARTRAAAQPRLLLLDEPAWGRWNVEQIGDACALRGIVGQAVHPAPVVEIVPHVEMRKQPGILEHVTDPPTMRRDVHACSGIVERLAVDDDAAAIGRSNPAIMLISEVLPAPEARTAR